MSNHAKEPWEAVEEGLQAALVCKGGRIGKIIDYDDALRIVVCVNSCAGMKDPKREIDGLRAGLGEWRDMAQDAIHRRETVKAQVSELSIAIKAALTDDPDWRRLCVDALARAEGRA